MHVSAAVREIVRAEVLLAVFVSGALIHASEVGPRASLTHGRPPTVTTPPAPRTPAAEAGPALLGRLQTLQRPSALHGLTPAEEVQLQPVPGSEPLGSNQSQQGGYSASNPPHHSGDTQRENGDRAPSQSGPSLEATEPSPSKPTGANAENRSSADPTKPAEKMNEMSEENQSSPPDRPAENDDKHRPAISGGDAQGTLERGQSEARPSADAPKSAVADGGTSGERKSKNETEVKEPLPEPLRGSNDSGKTNDSGKSSNHTSEPPTVGEPLAAGMVAIMRQEIDNGLKTRGVATRFNRFQQYAAERLDATSGRYTGSELTGNCRLRWYDYLLRHPLEAPAQAEKFTRELHTNILADHHGLARALASVAPKMNLPQRDAAVFPPITSPQQALDAVKSALIETQALFAAVLAPLSRSELRELQSYLVPVLVTQNRVGHTLQDRGTGRRMCDLLEKMDRDALWACAERLVVLTDPELLRQLRALPDDGRLTVEGVTGNIVARIATPGGVILIGGRGSNVYQLDRLTDVACIIDLGGNDGYADGTTSLQRPVLLVIDLDGNDIYRSSKPGVQGAAVLGVSMLLDLAGDDKYQAQDVAQGSALGGVGILIDYGGKDEYLGLRRVQGCALGGVGLLIDRGGDDTYRAAMWAQGFGGPLGFGMLDDLEGADRYFCGGQWPDSYEETPGLEGWGQGVGAGLRQVANGGIGVILDGGGDDVYEFDYLAHGGGYWCGVGFARDFGGNDQRLITRNSYGGGSRTEPKFQRFGCGWGCHYAVGFCIDDSGNDVYEGTIMGTGMAWDCAIGFLFDFGGDDRYEAAGGLTQGTGAQAGLGVLFDYNGDDNYRGYGQGYASPSITYHTMPGCGGNFSFVIDYGGDDKYGCGAKNNTYIQRGAEGGFLIDRPRRDELPESAPHAVAGAAGK